MARWYPNGDGGKCPGSFKVAIYYPDSNGKVECASCGRKVGLRNPKTRQIAQHKLHKPAPTIHKTITGRFSARQPEMQLLGTTSGRFDASKSNRCNIKEQDKNSLLAVDYSNIEQRIMADHGDIIAKALETAKPGPMKELGTIMEMVAGVSLRDVADATLAGPGAEQDLMRKVSEHARKGALPPWPIL